MKKVLLQTDKLSKSFSSGGNLQHVLKNIDLQLYAGDFTVIMGASGAGKSTLLYALSGMDTRSRRWTCERIISGSGDFRRGAEKISYADFWWGGAARGYCAGINQ